MPGLVFAPVSGRGLPRWRCPTAGCSRPAGTPTPCATWRPGASWWSRPTPRGPDSVARRAGARPGGRSAPGGRRQARGRAGPRRRSRLGVIGHSIGGGAAVLAAAADPTIGAVVTVTAAATSRRRSRRRAGFTCRACTWSAARTTWPRATAAAIAASWAGPAQLRTVKGASHLGLAEGTHWTSTVTGRRRETGPTGGAAAGDRLPAPSPDRPGSAGRRAGGQGRHHASRTSTALPDQERRAARPRTGSRPSRIGRAGRADELRPAPARRSGRSGSRRRRRPARRSAWACSAVRPRPSP